MRAIFGLTFFYQLIHHIQECSEPFGGGGGGPFSDRGHYKIGSKVTAFNIRIGGEGIDFIQVNDWCWKVIQFETTPLRHTMMDNQDLSMVEPVVLEPQ